MILLISGDSLRVVTGAAATVDVAVFYADHVSGVVTPGRQVTGISTATTTTVCAGPSSGQRVIRSLSIRNTHATTATTVTMQHHDGSTGLAIYAVTLAAGEQLIYSDNAGWTYLTAQGLPRVSQSQGVAAPAVGTVNLITLASDVVNNNSVANTMQDVTGLSFAVVAGSIYWFEFYIDYTANATTTGSRWSINGPTFSRLAYSGQWSLTATTVTVTGGLVAYDLPAASNATSAQVAGNIAWLTGFITPSADGSVVARFASEVASAAVTAKAGSICRWVQVA